MCAKLRESTVCSLFYYLLHPKLEIYRNNGEISFCWKLYTICLLNYFGINKYIKRKNTDFCWKLQWKPGDCSRPSVTQAHDDRVKSVVYEWESLDSDYILKCFTLYLWDNKVCMRENARSTQDTLRNGIMTFIHSKKVYIYRREIMEKTWAQIWFLYLYPFRENLQSILCMKFSVYKMYCP